ncbi:alpha/beta fold hydrolase [Streptococcus plurextorum]
MKRLYFLDGLGSHEGYTVRFRELLAKKKIDLVYLPYPENGFTSQADLLEWFNEQVDEDKIRLMGFSLGADLANSLTRLSEKVRQLILLDGGLRVHDLSTMSLDDELEEAFSYLERSKTRDLANLIAKEKEGKEDFPQFLEEAIRDAYVFDSRENQYVLKLSAQAVEHLIITRRESWQGNDTPLSVPTVVILAGQPKHYAEEKRKRLLHFSNLAIYELSESGHQLYLEKDEELASLLDKMITI